MRKMPLPPGPKGRFLIGNIPEFKKDIMGFLKECQEKYGDLCWFKMGPMKVCLISEPNLIRQILQDDADKVMKPWGLRQLKVALGDGLFTSEGEVWKRQRKIVQQAFHNSRVKEYGHVMVAQGDKLFSQWQLDETRDVHHDTMQLTLEIVAESLFGMAFTPEMLARIQTPLDNFQNQFEKLLSQMIPIPFSWPTPSNRWLKKQVNDIHEIIRGFIADREGLENDEKDLLGFLLAKQKEMNLSEKQILDEVLTMLMAGHETTGSTLSLAFWSVAQHPEVDKKLQEEITEVLGDRLPTPDDFPNLVYAQNIIQETMRLYPAAWSIARETLDEIQLGEYCIPKGTQLMTSQYIMHRMEKYFPEPDEFKPERWQAQQKRSEMPKYAFLPFGGGPRFCVGSNFASMEATLLLAMCFQRFRLEVAPDHKVELQPSITLRPRNGIKLIVRKR